jgi:uncharacterized phage-associated protein
MNKTYSPFEIANFFIKKSHDTGITLTPMKLLKLVFIAHGWHLGLYGTELLTEVSYAWKYGPVIDSLYHAFRKYSNNQIDSLYSDSNGNTPYPSSEILPFLEKIWDIYKNKSAIQLSALTHETGSPWDIIYNERGGKNQSFAIIPNQLIKNHYTKLVDQAKLRADA